MEEKFEISWDCIVSIVAAICAVAATAMNPDGYESFAGLLGTLIGCFILFWVFGAFLLWVVRLVLRSRGANEATH